MKTYTYNVIQTVEVEIDETMITDEYLESFSEVMWNVDSIKDIAKHIAYNKALFDGYPPEFVPKGCYTAEVVEVDTEDY